VSKPLTFICFDINYQQIELSIKTDERLLLISSFVALGEEKTFNVLKQNSDFNRLKSMCAIIMAMAYILLKTTTHSLKPSLISIKKIISVMNFEIFPVIFDGMHNNDCMSTGGK
jgi:hypothetical protein